MVLIILLVGLVSSMACQQHPGSGTADSTPPFTRITSAPAAVINDTTATITFTGSDDQTPPASLVFAWRLDGGAFTEFSSATTATLTGLAQVSHAFEVKARDLAGNEDPTPAKAVFRVNAPPTISLGAAPLSGTGPLTVTLTATANDPDGDPLTVTWNFGDGSTASGAAPQSHRYKAVGTYTATVTVSDGFATDQATATVTVNLPPDPKSVVPPIDRTVATSLNDATSFLYSGPTPIQTGVAAGTIEPRRAAVLRGKVVTRDGGPLPSVEITVLNHSEFGQTLSRADGMFDLAVNGGGSLTVQYQKDGFLPVQRPASVPWQDFVVLPDVTLVAFDAQATAIDLTAATPIQIAQGSAVTDADGRRQATLLFRQGTTASMTLADGTVQPLTNLTVRATEYTVGSAGPAAMPAPLPPTSAYTYAVELSADEAVATGAKQLRFSQPIVLYVENFLNFPVGGIVPVGFYDRDQAAWVASQNGRVVKILSITNSLADLDIDGSGVAAGATALAALGVTDAERQRLASLDQSGQSLWRVPITHFTPYDCNWPGLPVDATTPNQGPPKTEKQLSPCQQRGSIIGCQNQTLGEVVPVVGTSIGLHYSSDRVPGRKAAYSIDIPLSGASVPASLSRIDLDVQVAGRLFAQGFPAAPNQRSVFTWDGRDAYGRLLQGAQPITVRISYVYPGVYGGPRQTAQSFALSAGVPLSIVLDRTRREIVLTQEFQDVIGGWDARAQGLGAWSLTPHHAYDPVARVLYLGGGARRRAENLGRVIRTIAGTGVPGTGGDGGPAISASLGGLEEGGVEDIAAGPDGSLYLVQGSPFVSTGRSRIRRIAPNGIITTVAGGGAENPAQDPSIPPCDNCPATQTVLKRALAVAVGPDGSFYISVDDRVRRVGPDGIIRTVAGGGNDFVSDGIPALQAALLNVHGLVVGPDGSIYLSEGVGGHRVRRVGPDGFITTVAGRPLVAGFSGDGGAATQATLHSPLGIALGPDGSLYIADVENFRVRRVSPDGVIRTVAGTGEVQGPSGDGGLATNATIIPNRVSVQPDGSFYISEITAFVAESRIRLVGTDGIITTFAGGTSGFSGDGGPATAAQLSGTFGTAVAPDRTLSINDAANFRIRRVALAFPGFEADQQLAIVSEDGTELYQFTASGRHLRTLDTLTGAVRFQFAYDGAGRLVTVTDGSGNATTVERDGQGNATAIVAPGGQRTALTLNSDLATIRNPAGEAVQFTYTTDGLLTALTNPRGGLQRFRYDAVGRLIRDEGPDGGAVTLARTETANGFVVTYTTALGRHLTYEVEQQPTGAVRAATVDELGGRTEIMIGTDGTQTGVYPDGTHVTLKRGPDPRFGMHAPVLQSLTRTSPGGRTETIASQRTVSLTNVDDPLSLASLTQSVTINGRTFSATYDPSARRVTNTSPEGRQTATGLDARGRVIRTDPGPGLAPITLAYDAQGRVTQLAQGAQVWTYTYDAQNRLTRRTDALGRAIQYGYDAAGRVTTLTLPSGQTYQFGYDAGGNRTRVTLPSGSVHELDYTAADQLAAYVPPGGSPYSRNYDLDRRLARAILPGGRTLGQSYDTSGRLTALTSPDAVATFAYATSDPTERVGSITRMPTAGTATQGVAYAYDTNLVTQAIWTGVAAGQFSYAYGSDFYLTGITLVSGADLVQIPLSRDRDKLIVGFGPFTLTRGGPGGTVSRIADGTATLDYTYDSLGRWANRTVTVAGQAVYQGQISYDAAGRVTEKVESVGGTTHDLAYTYDADGQLTQTTRDGAVVERYTYDGNGNRTSRQSGGDPPEPASYDAQDRLTQRGGVGYQFDVDGFLAQRGADVFRYGARGELLQATVGTTLVTYAYDGLGRRVGRTDSGGTTQYLYGNPGNPFQVTHVRDAAGGLTTLYYDDGGRLFALERGGARFSVVTDAIGTPLVVVDATGTQVKAIQYDGFGSVTGDSNAGFQLPIGFAGGLTDSVTGLVGFGFRDYEPASGRWTARDPILFGGGQGNLYVYVRNNPVSFRDPLGLAACFGMSVYDIVGAGFQFCVGAEGVSVCEEFGFGFGGGVEINPLGSLANAGNSLIGQIGVSCGPLSLGAEASLNQCGDFAASAGGKLGGIGPTIGLDSEGNVSFGAKGHGAEAGSAGVSLDVEGPRALEGFHGKCNLTGKVAGQFCQRF